MFIIRHTIGKRSNILEIYLDVLFLENLVINYMILLVTHKIAKTPTSNLRKLSAAFVGALYVVGLILFPGVKYYYTMLSKILLSILIIAIAFPSSKIKTFIKTLIIFYISTFIFAGAAFSFLYFNNTGGFVKNGIVYVFSDSKMTVIFLSVLTMGIVLRVVWELMQHKFINQDLIIPITIVFESKNIDVLAYMDTGNSLYDPLTSVPVAVVEFNAIKTLLPLEIQKFFEENNEEDLTCITKILSTSTWFSRFRVIPFNSLGKENGILLGFRPDYIKIGEDTNREEVKDVIIGIYNKILSKNNSYKALIGPELIPN